MKTLSLIILFNICVSSLTAQVPPDTIFPVVYGNQVSIYQHNAYHNCAFEPAIMQVVVNDTLVNWYQVDTLGLIATCMCFFDYSVSIDTLKAGTYAVNVYTVYDTPLVQDTGYQGSTSFTIFEQNQCDNNVKISSTVGNCHEYNALKKHSSMEDQFSLQVSKDWILMKSIGSSRIANISLFNLSGQKTFSEKFDYISDIQIPTSMMNPGIYILSITNQRNETFVRKIPIF